MQIQPIALLKGAHADTATTGQGCFMNVIAYLNGESQITDESPCVCITVRPLAIKLNDLGTHKQRARLLPFVLRAMGSATKDIAVLDARKARLKQYSKECHELMQAWRAGIKAKNPSAYAYADAADAYARADARADAYACADAYAYACAYADANAKRLKASLFDAGLRFLDDVLPPAEPAGEVVLQRYETLAALQAA